MAADEDGAAVVPASPTRLDRVAAATIPLWTERSSRSRPTRRPGPSGPPGDHPRDARGKVRRAAAFDGPELPVERDVGSFGLVVRPTQGLSVRDRRLAASTVWMDVVRF